MPVSMQVIYPVSDGTHFDNDYYFATHMNIVAEHWGEHIQSTLVTKGIADGPDTPPSIYAVATIVFADRQKMNAAMAVGAPVLSDIPNFTNVKPQILIGEVMG